MPSIPYGAILTTSTFRSQDMACRQWFLEPTFPSSEAPNAVGTLITYGKAHLASIDSASLVKLPWIDLAAVC
ncbi:hypothetical protein Cob_v010953 [Colletotrichum orbiculare MAFF 240422]|uniref:Uncharacterized protein n=1 Tax=Colletotrichum orbiculare (strain 104-T / ATCC 96160 / CBS 514.97 / LARS 414 / MAFF 240422) TaxID=1213857 RepID=A0A484FD77_COLOR|nr:hypothetical protein Cob_v010953 [Colletotrichum orbiculare MAFF 240422]